MQPTGDRIPASGRAWIIAIGWFPISMERIRLVVGYVCRTSSTLNAGTPPTCRKSRVAFSVGGKTHSPPRSSFLTTKAQGLRSNGSSVWERRDTATIRLDHRRCTPRSLTTPSSCLTGAPPRWESAQPTGILRIDRENSAVKVSIDGQAAAVGTISPMGQLGGFEIDVVKAKNGTLSFTDFKIAR